MQAGVSLTVAAFAAAIAAATRAFQSHYSAEEAGKAAADATRIAGGTPLEIALAGGGGSTLASLKLSAGASSSIAAAIEGCIGAGGSAAHAAHAAGHAAAANAQDGDEVVEAARTVLNLGGSNASVVHILSVSAAADCLKRSSHALDAGRSAVRAPTSYVSDQI